MPPIVSSIEIARPPDEVFSYVTDPLRFPDWQSDVVSVRMEGDRPPGVGSRFTTTRRIGGTERTMTQEITEIRPPQELGRSRRRWADQASREHHHRPAQRRRAVTGHVRT
jgi:uncharacterized protein YndB with AHSA1/START domain